MQRKKVVKLYENGFTFGKQTCRYDEIKTANLKQINQTKQTGEIIKTNGEKIILPEIIFDVPGVLRKIEEKLK
jgi:hypothetical protein